MFSCQRDSDVPLLFTYVKSCADNVTKTFIGQRNGVCLD